MYQLKLYGLGGQGVVMAAQILSHSMAIHENKFAKTIPNFGHERRGAPVFSDVMVADTPIFLNSFVYHPDMVVVFDATVMTKGVDISKGIREKSVLVINTDQPALLTRVKELYSFAEIYYIQATRIAVEHIGYNIPNGPMLGAIAKTGLVAMHSIHQSLAEFFKHEGGERNVHAAQEAYRRTSRF